MPLAEQQWCPTSVQVTVLQARGLRIKGKGGTNDAYAVMQVGKEKFQTSVVEKSVAPAWREEAAFDLPPLLHQDGGGGKERGTLHVHVLHRALVGPDKLLGQAVVNLLQLGEDKTREKTEWFKLLDKTGKADKDRGEVLLDIQFMRHNMTASMFDLSATGKSRSRLGKFKDKVRGKKKESDTASDLVPSFTQVLTESDEEGPGDGEASAAKGDKKKKHKMKSLFSQKSNLQKNMSQSMTVLTAKNLSLSGSQSSGLNVDSSEGKKKFKFLIHKRSNSSDSKDASSAHQKHGAAEPSNVCINGSHVYCEEPPPRASRVGSNFSLASSGHGSMEDVPESSPPSVDSLKGVRQYSPWTEEEEEQELENTNEDAGQLRRDEEEKLRMEEEMRRNEELERLADEKRRREEEERRTEEDNVKREEEERIRRDEEERRQQQEEEERVKREQEECDRLAEQKWRLQEQERLIEEEIVRKEEEERIHEEKRQKEDEMVRRQEVEREEKRFEEQERSLKEEEERTRMEEESAKKERRRQEEEERVRRQEEECKLAEEKRLEEEERIEEDKLRKEEEERIRREKEMAEEERKRGEEMMRRQEEKHNEKTRLEEQERRRREHKERIMKEEEQKARREKEEHERLVEEKRKLEEEERIKVEEEQKARRDKEEHERLVEEKRKLEEEERIKVEEEQKARRDKEEHDRLVEEKRKLEEEDRIKAEEKIRREEEERIRVEEERRNEEERVRRQEEEREQLAEEKRILEEQERRRDKERKQREEEEMRIREEENSRKEKEENERLAVEKMRQQEQERRMIEEEKIKREEEERVRRKEKAERERKEEEARKKEKLTREAEEQNKDNKTKHKAAGRRSGQKVAVESRAEVTSTNPFDENVSSNPFEEIPDSPAGPGSSSAEVPTDQQRVQSAASSVGSKPVSSDEKDPINIQRERRPAPQPPGRNPAERPSQREQDGATQQLAQINKKSKDKDIKTVSVLPQRSVQTIAPMSRASTEKKNTQSLTQSCATKETSNIVKHSKRTAPPTPRSAEEEPTSEHKTALSSDNISHECGSEAKLVSIVHGLNPFEDDDVENASQDDSTTSGNTRSVKCPQVLSQAASKDAASQAKNKSSKAHAPPLPTKIAATSSTSILQSTERGHVAAGAGVTVNSVLHLTRDPASEAVSPVRVQEAPLQETEPAPMQSAGGDSGGMKVGPPKASRRLQPVKPLNSLEQQSVSVVQGVKENNSTCDVQVKTKVNDTGLKGPYSQLTQGELISLVLKQEKQLSEKDKKISELEKYIDDLLVRVIEEKPSILMSMNSLKKST